MFEGISGDVEVVGTSIKDKTYPKRPSRRGSCEVVGGRIVAASCKEEVGVGRCFGEGDRDSKAGRVA
jgi:hypothetical protein